MGKRASRLKRTSTMLVLLVVLVGMLVPANLAFATTTINITGSTTVGPIVDDSQYQFPLDFPQYTLGIPSTATGWPGSGTGISSICAGTVDIGLSSRNLTGTDCQGTLYSQSQLIDNDVAYDAVLPVVNKNNPCAAAGRTLTDVSTAILKQIYNGSTVSPPSASTLYDWSLLCPGASLGQNIIPRARIVGSGTRASWDSFVGLCDETSSPPCSTTGEPGVIALTGQARLQQNEDVSNAIAANSNQIGYTGLAWGSVPPDPPGQFYNSNNQDLTVNGISATISNVKSFTYPFSRFLHMFYVNQTVKADQPAVDYVNWILGPKGQALVNLEGFIPIQANAPAWDVNVDHVANIGDIVSIGNFWNQPCQNNTLTGSPFKGWIRQDSNVDCVVNIGDVVYVGNFWNQSW